MSSDQWPLIYFIRHGQTDWNKDQRFQGQRDIPLNDHGRAQALQNGNALRGHFEQQQIDPNTLDWFCSPLGRTKETMRLVRSRFKTSLPQVEYDERLKEISFGILEGVLLSEMQRDHPEEFAARTRSKWEHLPPKGENYHQLIERLSRFGQDLRGPAVIVAHGGVARALRGHLAGAPQEELNDWPAPQDKIMCFDHGDFRVFE